MIKLFGFGPLWGQIDLSPFVTKVDAYLRLSNLPFEVERYPFLGVGGAPKRKLPFIEDDGERIADSGFIVERLRRKHGADLDLPLNPRQKATAHSLKRMVEEHLYWVLVQLRWRVDGNWETFMAEVFGDWRIDGQLAAFLPMVREGVIGQMTGHGIGRHSVDEVWTLGMQDVDAIAAVMADKPYVMGSEPTSVDTTVFAFLTHLQAGLQSRIADHFRAHENLTGYCERMSSALYGGEKSRDGQTARGLGVVPRAA